MILSTHTLQETDENSNEPEIGHEIFLNPMDWKSATVNQLSVTSASQSNSEPGTNASANAFSLGVIDQHVELHRSTSSRYFSSIRPKPSSENNMKTEEPVDCVMEDLSSCASGQEQSDELMNEIIYVDSGLDDGSTLEYVHLAIVDDLMDIDGLQGVLVQVNKTEDNFDPINGNF